MQYLGIFFVREFRRSGEQAHSYVFTFTCRPRLRFAVPTPRCRSEVTPQGGADAAKNGFAHLLPKQKWVDRQGETRVQQHSKCCRR
jgi:hypothetical protein